jgi:hypothetical protein
VWNWCEKQGRSPKAMIKHWSWGLIQSRLFTGSWELENYEQNFALTCIKGSLVSMHYRQLKQLGVNVFTASSWAFPILIKDLGEKRRLQLKRYRLKTLGNPTTPEGKTKVFTDSGNKFWMGKGFIVYLNDDIKKPKRSKSSKRGKVK